MGHGRGGASRRRCGHRGGHGRPIRRDRPGGRLHIHDHQRSCSHPAGHVRGGGRGVRRRAVPPGRHASERHPQGIPGPEGVPVPAPAVGPPGHRRHSVHHGRDAPVESGIGLRLSHPGGRLHGRPGTGLHSGQRVRIRGGGLRRWPSGGLLRTAAEFLLQQPRGLLRGGGQVQGRSSHLGPVDAGPLWSHRRAQPQAPIPHPDGRGVVDRAAARGQHCPGGAPSAGRGDGGYPEPPHR